MESYKVINYSHEHGLEAFAELIRSIFLDPKVDYTMNWLVLSTSGVHGSYGTIDDAEYEEDYFVITATIFQPRRVSIAYGNAKFHRSDCLWLRQVVANTLQGMVESQRGNLPLYDYDTDGFVKTKLVGYP